MESKHANIALKTIIIIEFSDKINDDSSSTIIALLIFGLGFKYLFHWRFCFVLIALLPFYTFVFLSQYFHLVGVLTVYKI